MDQQLIAGIAATLTLGAAIVGSTRYLLKSLERIEKRITCAILGIRAELKERNMISGFRGDMKDERQRTVSRVKESHPQE